MPKIAVITGASGGIGLAAARLFTREGWTVYNLSRHPAPDGSIHVPADVTSDAAVRAAFEEIARREDGIDLLVNNAGMGISGAAETTPVEDARRQFDVSFFGALRCAQAALPLLRARKGRIVNVSSVAALFAIPFQSFYSAAKSALDALTLAMDNECRAFGVRCVAILPGDVSTGFTDARRKLGEEDPIYGARIRSSVAVMERDERGGMTPDVVARAIWRAGTQKSPKPLRCVGGKYRFFGFLFKILPTRLANWIVGKMYC